MKVRNPPIHPAAALLPLLAGDERAELKESLRHRGQLVPVQLHNGKVIDGRNRLELLRELGVEPKFAEANLRGRTPAQYVVDMNLERRMLSASQKGALALRLMPELKKAVKASPAKAGKRHVNTAAAKAAKLSKVSTRTVERAIAIEKLAPHLLPAVVAGELTLKQAEKKIRHKEALKKIAAYVPPAGKFQLITVDFPWEYEDKLDGSDAVRGGLPYPPMKVEEILKFVRTQLAPRCDEVCLLACWVTNPIMLDLQIWPWVQRAIEEIGFRPVKLQTWRKIEADGGPFTGLGNGVRNDTEQLVLFARGHVIYNELGEAHGRPLQRTCFDAPIGEHSEKPQRAYDRLELLVPYAPRLEMFSRAPRDGWVTSGAEMPEAAPAPVGGPTSSGAKVGPALVPPVVDRSTDAHAQAVDAANLAALAEMDPAALRVALAKDVTPEKRTEDFDF